MNESRQKFIQSLEKNCQQFGVHLSAETINKLAVYYELVQKNNQFLHLVAPSPPEVFATRHILESLALLEFLPENSKFADVGAGAGLPSVPCLIARADLRGILVESKLKKSKFLQEVLAECKLERRAEIINRQFEEIQKPDVSYVLCRALDKFTQKLPRLLKWSGGSNLLFFGGNSLRDVLRKNGVKFNEKLMPMSEQRFLFVAQKPSF
ncbi:MAG: class I SAM-dependent methyltransferase [Acidobacteriota bacterium]|nr:class I SAM-dependent methyltransferase [Acidobacteriota bacterium]